ncbi:uncharacterized membrane protein At1g75140-like [Andrographis paniculata]|uniref:uncharacterized membrane protein At1g75140-like n=1 Tax=Andrographis paniculata TaxID=175694 RepID=UPI0021E94887|nr:uncharacterized membrane protein At1g75140-like [Andrographis paniculata]
MTINRDGGKLLLAFTFSLLISNFLYSTSVSASNSNFIVQTGGENGSSFNGTVGSSNSDAVLMRNHLRRMEVLVESIRNLTHDVARLESKFIPYLSNSDAIPSSRGEFRALAGINGGETPSGGLRRPIWSEWFQFVAAVKLSTNPNCMNLLPFRDSEGLNRYFAVGDDHGSLYVFCRTGDVAMQLNSTPNSESNSPVTSMVSYLSIHKNETMLISGHENGVITKHRIYEGEESTTLVVDKIRKFRTIGLEGSSIKMLKVHYIGQRRYILAVNDRGKIIVFNEDGSLHGVVSPKKCPIVFLKQRLLFLTETGAGSLDLRTMKLKELDCDGANGTVAVRYVFDIADRTNAYGFTSDGEFIHTVLFGDATSFKCRFRFKTRLGVDKPLDLVAIRGYVMTVDEDEVYVYNVSTQPYVRIGMVRFLLSARLDEIAPSFFNREVVGKRGTRPLIVSDYEKDVVVSFRNGYIAIYRSKLPVIEYEFNSVWWTVPVLFFTVFIFVAWHYLANNGDPLTSFGSTTGDRLLEDSSRSNRFLLDPSRSFYGSSRYGCQGVATSFYKSCADVAPVDHHFVPSFGMKFRSRFNAQVGGMSRNFVDDNR